MCLIIVQATAGASSELGTVADLIQENLFRNSEKIEEIFGTLTDIERLTIFKKIRKTPMLPFYANLAVGFGVGSFIQKNLLGGFIALIGDGLGVALPILGYACIMQDYYGYELIYAGYAFLGITRIFEYIRPFAYARRYITALRKGLQQNESPKFSIILSQDGIGVSLAMN